MKICLALTSFLPISKGGTELYAYNLAKHLINSGYKVDVVIPAKENKSKKYSYDNISVFTYLVPPKASAQEMNGLKETGWSTSFINIINWIKPDIVHFHSFTWAMDSRLLKAVALTGVKTIYTPHLGGVVCARNDLRYLGQHPCDGKVKVVKCNTCIIKKKGYNSKASFLLSKLLFGTGAYNLLLKKYPQLNFILFKQQELRTISRYTSKVIAIAPWMFEALKINGVRNLELVTSGVNTKIFTPSFNKPRNYTLNFIYVGRLYPIKGLDILLEALERLHKKTLEKINLTIVTIPDESELSYYNCIKEKFLKLGFSDWQESLSHEDLVNVLSNQHLLIAPSRSEVAPLTILEAFALKIPVLGSDIPAIQNMIKDNVNGMLFKSENISDLSEALTSIIEEPEVLQKWSDQIETVKTIQEVGEEMVEIYKNILIQD